MEKAQNTKTTLRIDTYLKRLADEKAKKEGIKLQSIVNSALKAYLNPEKSDKSWISKLTPFNLGVLVPLTKVNIYKTDEEIIG